MKAIDRMNLSVLKERGSILMFIEGFEGFLDSSVPQKPRLQYSFNSDDSVTVVVYILNNAIDFTIKMNRKVPLRRKLAST